MYRLLVFDFFDVLHEDPFKKWLKISGLERDKFQNTSQMVDMGEISEKEFYKQLSQLSDQSYQAVKDVFTSAGPVDNDLLNYIGQLKKTYKTALISNASSEYLRPIIDMHNLDEFFDELIISAEVRLAKPDKAVFHHLLKKMKIKSGQAIFIDDDARNVEAAAQIGIDAVLYKNISALKKELNKRNIVLN